MYPLNVVLVGCSDEVLPAVKKEVLDQPADLEAVYPDVNAAIASLRLQPHDMRLFVQHVKSREELNDLRRLGGTYVGRPILAMMDASKDGTILIHAMRNGANQVVTLPLQTEDFRTAMNCIGVQFGSTGDATVVTVSGVTGGCGATTLAINLASEIAYLRRVPCILVELSLQMGMLATYLDIEPKLTTHELLSDMEQLDIYRVQHALTQITDDFHVLAGPYRAITALTAPVKDVNRLIDYAKRLARVVVLDVPCTYDDRFFETLAGASQVVLVGEQKVPSVRALLLLQDTLEGHALHLVINRYDAKIPGFGARDLEKLLGVPQVLTVANDYAAATAAANSGKPLRQLAPQARALADIDHLARVLLPSAEEQPAAGTTGDQKNILGRLIRAFGRT